MHQGEATASNPVGAHPSSRRRRREGEGGDGEQRQRLTREGSCDRIDGVVDARVDSRVGRRAWRPVLTGIPASGATLATPVAKADAEAAWPARNEVVRRHRHLAGDRDVVRWHGRVGAGGRAA